MERKSNREVSSIQHDDLAGKCEDCRNNDEFEEHEDHKDHEENYDDDNEENEKHKGLERHTDHVDKKSGNNYESEDNSDDEGHKRSRSHEDHCVDNEDHKSENENHNNAITYETDNEDYDNNRILVDNIGGEEKIEQYRSIESSNRIADATGHLETGGLNIDLGDDSYKRSVAVKKPGECSLEHFCTNQQLGSVCQ